MSEQSTSERDSLLEAIRLAEKEVARAQEARQQAEEKLAALQVQMERQYTTFVFMRSRLEKMGVPVDSWDEDLDEQIKSLESQYEQSLAENRRLKELLEEKVTEDASQPVPATPSAPAAAPAPAEQGGIPEGLEILIDIEASPRHTNRFRR